VRSAFALALLVSLAACGEAPAARPDVGVIRLASFNVWGVPLASEDLAGRLERMPDALRALDADVLCLQEVFLAATRDRLVEGLGPEYEATEGRRGGLLILSRFPIRATSFERFPVAGRVSLAERLAGKGVLEAVVETPAGEVRVVTAHLAAVFDDERPRAVQRRFLLERLDGSRDRPVVLAADLNTALVDANGPTTAWTEFADAGFSNVDPPRRGADGAWASPRPTRVGWPRTGLRRGWTPDHVLLRDGSEIGVEVLGYEVRLDRPDTALSDHNLLLVTLRLTRE